MARAWHHLPLSAIAVLWNLLLVGHYLGHTFSVDVFIRNFTENEAAFYGQMPQWQAILWAIAVWSGLLAAILLADRRATGVVFALSFVSWAMTAAAWHWLRAPSVGEVFGQTGLTLVLVACGAAFFYAIYARWMHTRWRYRRGQYLD
ncbi:MAG: hypothetical protein AAF748_11380 [Pseudomonadota bacterium]